MSELFFPIDPGRELHHHKQCDDRTNRDGQPRETLKKESVGKQDQKNELGTGGFDNRKSDIDDQSQISHDEQHETREQITKLV